MRAHLFAQWSWGAILQPTDVHEYASGEEYFKDGGKNRQITPETEKHSSDATRIRWCRALRRLRAFVGRAVPLVHRRLPGVGLFGMAGAAEDERAVAAVGARNGRHP